MTDRHVVDYSKEPSYVSRKSSLVSKKYCLIMLYDKSKIKVNANIPYTEINSSFWAILQLKETDTLTFLREVRIRYSELPTTKCVHILHA